MNPQIPPYTYPPPPAPQLAYHNPYSLPAPQQYSTPNQLPPYPYTSQPGPQHIQQQQQEQYIRSYQTPQPQPALALPPHQQQQQPQQQQLQYPPQNGQSSRQSSPEEEAGAASPSPGMEDYEANLVNALGPEGQQPDEAEDDDNGGEEPIFHLPPPPENTYASQQELETAMHAWSLEHGYELVRRASKKNARGSLYKRYYHCSKHGLKSNTGNLTAETRVRANRKSNRINCPMSVAVVALDPINVEGQWQIRHRKTHHTHGPSDAIQLTGHRRRARGANVEKAVDGLFDIGTSTAQVLQFLQKTSSGGLFTRTDVANMKLKWKKFGTTADRLLGRAEQQRRARLGLGAACQKCRQKKRGCDREKPGCGQCTEHGVPCIYDRQANKEGGGDDTQMDQGASISHIDLPDATPATQQQHVSNEPVSTDPAPAKKGRMSNHDLAETQRILQTLQNFTQETIKPTRLTLLSSAVETLAHSSCGNGDTFKSLPVLQSHEGWPAFRDAMIDAAMKENTYEVLIGAKTEPEEPPEVTGQQIEVEIWNEYVKQVAIYKRRNMLLVATFSTRLGPSFKSCTKGLNKASVIWATLEELCAPRGSEAGFQLFVELHAIDLANSKDLSDYIQRLQSVYHRFGQMKLNTSPPPLGRRPDQLPTAVSGQDAMPEEMMCFLFLKGLGAHWRRWVDGVCATNNIGGFGTGERLGFKELCKRAQGHEATQWRGMRG